MSTGRLVALLAGNLKDEINPNCTKWKLDSNRNCWRFCHFECLKIHQKIGQMNELNDEAKEERKCFWSVEGLGMFVAKEMMDQGNANGMRPIVHHTTPTHPTRNTRPFWVCGISPRACNVISSPEPPTPVSRPELDRPFVTAEEGKIVEKWFNGRQNYHKAVGAQKTMGIITQRLLLHHLNKMMCGGDPPQAQGDGHDSSQWFWGQSFHQNFVTSLVHKVVDDDGNDVHCFRFERLFPSREKALENICSHCKNWGLKEAILNPETFPPSSTGTGMMNLAKEFCRREQVSHEFWKSIHFWLNGGLNPEQFSQDTDVHFQLFSPATPLTLTIDSFCKIENGLLSNSFGRATKLVNENFVLTEKCSLAWSWCHEKFCHLVVDCNNAGETTGNTQSKAEKKELVVRFFKTHTISKKCPNHVIHWPTG